MAEIQCGIRENEKILDGIRHLTTFREAGLAKILARDAALGKKRVFGLGMTEVRVCGIWRDKGFNRYWQSVFRQNLGSGCVLRKKTAFEVEMTEVRVAEFS